MRPRKFSPHCVPSKDIGGAYLVRRPVGDIVELLVPALWDSMQAVRKFAGAEPNRAAVEPEARAVLTSYNDYVTHFEVISHPETKE